jgi:FtsH-binding integral membrane protein
MDFVNQFSSSRFDINTLLKTSALTSDVRTHLSKVYMALAGTTGFMAIGVYLSSQFNLMLSPWIFTLLGFGALMYIGFTEDTKANIPQRLAALFAFGLLQGFSLAPLILLAIEFDPSIVFQAVVLTMIVFISFSLCAMFAERRSYLYLGGIFTAFFNMLFWSSLMNLFFRSSFPFQLNLYGGLVIFSLYIIYDTQMIIEKRLLGSQDFIKHSLDLFLDLVAVFVRILILLMKNKAEKREKESRKERK